MKMKSWGVALALSGTLFMPLTAAAEDLLTGDVRLACEAILCLSSGDRPSECKPSLDRYFSIKHKKLGDTIRARRDFLNMCPSSNEPGMRELNNALANGAGRCDAKELNRVMRRTITVRECTEPDKNSGWLPRGNRGQWCRDVQKVIVLNSKPSYCTAYHQHDWTTTNESIRYEGDPQNGGRWVDVK